MGQVEQATFHRMNPAAGASCAVAACEQMDARDERAEQHGSAAGEDADDQGDRGHLGETDRPFVAHGRNAALHQRLSAVTRRKRPQAAVLPRLSN